MKVLWINNEATFKGGAERYIFDCVQYFSQSTQIDSYLYYDVSSRVDPSFIQPFSFACVLSDLILQLNTLKPDLIYLHQYNDPKIFKLLAQQNIPIIFFVHDHKYFCPREHKYTALKHLTCTKSIGLGCYSCCGCLSRSEDFPYLKHTPIQALKDIHHHIQGFANTIVASEYMKNHLIEHGFQEDKLSLLPLFTSPDTPIHKVIKNRGILFVGQLIRGKGLDTLLHALSGIDIELDICGEGKQEEELKRLSKELGVNAIFHGKQKAESLNKMYQESSFVVIPSRAPETFNLVGLEAMKNKKAVIATDVGGISQWLQDGNTGILVPSGSDFALRAAITHLINKPSLCKQMGLKGYQHFKHSFLPHHHLKALYELFKSHLNIGEKKCTQNMVV